MDNGALADLNLGTDPWNTNRYTFAGGNPITRIELDGHVNECLSCGGAGGHASVLAQIQTEPEAAPEATSGQGGGILGRATDAGRAFVRYQGGIGAQAVDTVKGVGQLQSANIDCLASGDCRQHAAMATTLVTEPTTVLTATIDPVRNDWEEGNRARAAGRVAFMLGEAIASSRGASKLASSTAHAADKAPLAERLFTNRQVGVDSRILGHSYARGSSGLLNRTGPRLKFGWTSSGEFGGGWHLRMGIGRNSVKPNQGRPRIDFGSTHLPNSIANDLLDVIRQLRGLG